MLCRGGRNASELWKSFARFRRRTAETFVRVDDQLKKLARYLQPFFLEPPPEPGTQSFGGWSETVSRGQALPGHLDNGNLATGVVSYGQCWATFSTQLRIGKGERRCPRQQRLWQTRRSLPAGTALDCCFTYSAEENTTSKASTDT